MYLSVRYFFDTQEGAVEALLLLLEDARTTDKYYEFGSLSADQILASGLILRGDIHDLLHRLDAISGAMRVQD